MSIEIRLTKELGDYEPKLIGPFTGRQCLCLLIGLPFCYLTYSLTAPFLPIDVAGFLIAIPGCIAAIFGWWKPYGMKPEKFLQSIVVNMFLAPTNRVYKTKNIHEDLLHVLEQGEEKENSDPASLAKKKKQEKHEKKMLAKTVVPGRYF